MVDKSTGVPKPTDKSKSKDALRRGERADTGGDQFDRARGDYSKKPVGPIDLPDDYY